MSRGNNVQLRGIYLGFPPGIGNELAILSYIAMCGALDVHCLHSVPY
jgi:hypothetical protein